MCGCRTDEEVLWTVSRSPMTASIPGLQSGPGLDAKTLKSWAFPAEPPWGIEPQTYALREARGTAPGAPPAPIAPLASRNALNAQGAPDSRSTIRSTTGPGFR